MSKHRFKSGATVRVVDRNQLRGGKRYHVRGKQMSLLSGIITCNGNDLVQITYDDGGTEYAHPNNVELADMDSPLKWHGGKHYLASRIVSLMPTNVSQYIEPFGGSLAVLLERTPDNCAEIVNDLSGELMNFWRVLQNQNTYPQFERRVQCIPFSEQAFYDAHTTNAIGHIDRAVNFFVRCRQSRAGCFKDFATMTRSRTRRGMNEQASAWLGAVARLPEVHARLMRVAILCRPAINVIREQDCAEAFFYLDPPYVEETRTSVGQYSHEMSIDEHAVLLSQLSRLQGKFILSGYRCTLYDRASDAYNWYRIDIDMPNNAAGGDEKRRMTESLWLNYNPY